MTSRTAEESEVSPPDLFRHRFRALRARTLAFQDSLGLQIFLGCIFIPNQGMQRDKIHLWNGIQKNVFIWALDSDEKHTIESLFRKVRNQDDRQVDAESLGCCTGALVVELGDNGQWRNCLAPFSNCLIQNGDLGEEVELINLPLIFVVYCSNYNGAPVKMVCLSTQWVSPHLPLKVRHYMGDWRKVPGYWYWSILLKCDILSVFN